MKGNSKTEKEYGYPVLKGFTQGGVRHEKGSLFKPDNPNRRSWLATYQRHGMVSTEPECREVELAEDAGEEAVEE